MKTIFEDFLIKLMKVSQIQYKPLLNYGHLYSTDISILRTRLWYGHLFNTNDSSLGRSENRINMLIN